MMLLSLVTTLLAPGAIYIQATFALENGRMWTTLCLN